MLAAAAGRATGKFLRKLGIYDQVTSAASDISRVLSGVFRLVIVIGALAFFGSIFYGVWDVVDESGWISHTRDTTITAQSDWLVGESKTCMSFPLDPGFATSIGREKNDVAYYIKCDKGAEHQISVTFWGRVVRSDRRAAGGVNWRCVKKSDSFACYALN